MLTLYGLLLLELLWSQRYFLFLLHVNTSLFTELQKRLDTVSLYIQMLCD